MEETKKHLGVLDTGALYRSVVAVGATAGGKYTSVNFREAFRECGFYDD